MTDAEILKRLLPLVGTINDGWFHGHRPRTLLLLNIWSEPAGYQVDRTIHAQLRKLDVGDAILAAAGYPPTVTRDLPGRIDPGKFSMKCSWLANWSILYQIDENLTVTPGWRYPPIECFHPPGDRKE